MANKLEYDVPEGMSRDFYKEITTDCLEALSTPYALYLKCAFGDDPKNIRTPLPSSYLTAAGYYSDAQAYACLAKNSALDSPYELEVEALGAFIMNEIHCRDTNDKIRTLIGSNHRVGYKPPYWVMDVKNNIRYLIGSRPNLGLNTPNSSFYGPGQTTTHHGRSVNLFHKIVRQHECTSGCRKMAEWLFSGSRVGFDPIETRHSIFGTVPKSAKTLRGICTEPGYNLNCQKFIGDCLRHELKKKAYDLSLQHYAHKAMVREASITGSHATLDLKAASDTISYEVIKLLFPEEWFHLMNQARSHYVNLHGIDHKLQKFSSMGNGFTFEMESILFLAILMTLPNNDFIRKGTSRFTRKGKVTGTFDGDISVFGDDIICRSADAPLAIERLEFFGFVINESKSFTDGIFRESCGADFFNGVDVRPIYLKGPSSDGNPQDWFNLANAIYEMSYRVYGREPRVTRFSKAHSKVIKNCPPEFREFGPKVQLDSSEEGYPFFLSTSPKILSANSGMLRYVYAVYPVLKKERVFGTDDEIIAYATLGGSSKGSPIRGRLDYIRKTRFAVCP